MNKPFKVGALVAVVALLSTTGCTPTYSDARKPGNTTLQAAAGGALIGAGVGALVSKKDRGKGALVGAAGGALAGSAIGYMSEPKQAPAGPVTTAPAR
jgi:hypothetical protein